MNKYIFDDAGDLCKAAAEHILQLSNEAIAKKGKFTIALSGGNTPKKLYELLVEPPYAAQFDWKNIFFFWGDERCVPFADKDNNSNMVFTALLNKIKVPPENIFRMPVNLQPQEAANVYEQTLLTFFNEAVPHFDLVLLGLGDNGHTASLFPHTPVLHEKISLVKEVFINELNMYRISFTARLINNAEHILFLVTGEAKAEIIKIIFSGVKDPEKYPVQLIDPVDGSIDWYLDKAASAQL